MTTKTQIEVDEATTDALKTRAAERGVTVATLVAELVNHDSAPLAVESDELAELERRWASVEAGAATTPHEEVVRWLDTWGTPAFRPWHE